MSHAILTVDLGFGDAGKGSIVDYLTREHGAHTVVRYSGGAQAGHRVVTAEGHEHIFSQVGAGTLAGADSFLSRYMLVEPLAMRNEAAHLATLGHGDALARLALDERATVITPFHRAINRLRELARGAGRHGSCGIGVGETVRDRLRHGDKVLYAADLRDPDRLHQKLLFLRAVARAKRRALAPRLPESEAVAAECEWLDDRTVIPWLIAQYRAISAELRLVPPSYLASLLARPGTILFEAAQGVLLDEWRGFHPHTTWATVTLEQADALLREGQFGGTVERLGISRAYTPRHGAGPLVTEEAALTAALPDAMNGAHPWQEGFRVGWLDLVALRYAREAVGPLDGLAITCLDRLDALPALFLCDRYDRLDVLPLSTRPRDLAHQARLTRRLAACRPLLTPVESPDALLRHTSAALGLPITLRSYGPTAAAKLR